MLWRFIAIKLSVGLREIFRKRLLGEGYIVVVRRGFLEIGFKNISYDFNVALDDFVNNQRR